MTSAWVFAMDALAAGLIVMVIGSYYMWWRLKQRKTLGVVTLAAGVRDLRRLRSWRTVASAMMRAAFCILFLLFPFASAAQKHPPQPPG